MLGQIQPCVATQQKSTHEIEQSHSKMGKIRSNFNISKFLVFLVFNFFVMIILVCARGSPRCKMLRFTDSSSVIRCKVIWAQFSLARSFMKLFLRFILVWRKLPLDSFFKDIGNYQVRIHDRP